MLRVVETPEQKEKRLAADKKKAEDAASGYTAPIGEEVNGGSLNIAGAYDGQTFAQQQSTTETNLKRETKRKEAGAEIEKKGLVASTLGQDDNSKLRNRGKKIGGLVSQVLNLSSNSLMGS